MSWIDIIFNDVTRLNIYVIKVCALYLFLNYFKIVISKIYSPKVKQIFFKSNSKGQLKRKKGADVHWLFVKDKWFYS